MPLQIQTERLIERLLSQRETGMTSQFVTVHLTDGRQFSRVCAVGGQLSDESGTWTPPFVEADIADIVVSDDRSGPPVASAANVSASFSYEPGEYARALRRVQERRHRARIDSLVAIALLGWGGYLWATAGFTLWVALLCGVVLLFLAMLAFAVLVVPHLVERSQAKFRQPYALSFSAEGIHFRTPTIDSRVSWSLYHSWSEDNDYLYLFHGKRDLTVLPIRALARPEDRAAVRDLVSYHIAAKATG